MLCRSAAQAQHLPRRSGLTPAGQCNSPRPQTLMGGRGRRSGGGFSRPQGKQAPPTLAGHSATGEGQRGGGVATEEPTATTTKNFNGGSFAKWPPAAAAARGRQARPHGGAQRSRRDGRAGFSAPPRVICPPTRAGRAAEQAESRWGGRECCPPRAYRKSAAAIGGSTPSGKGGQRLPRGRERHASKGHTAPT